MRQKVAPHGRIYASHKKLRPTTNITNSKKKQKKTTKDNNNTSKRNDRVNAIRAKWLQQVCKLVYMYHVHTFLTSATIATTMHVHWQRQCAAQQHCCNSGQAHRRATNCCTRFTVPRIYLHHFLLLFFVCFFFGCLLTISLFCHGFSFVAHVVDMLVLPLVRCINANTCFNVLL